MANESCPPPLVNEAESFFVEKLILYYVTMPTRIPKETIHGNLDFKDLYLLI